MSTGVPNLNPTNPKGMTSNYNTDYNSETTTNPIGPASQLKGHAQYVTGAAQEVIGGITNSEAWRNSGIENKNAAVEEMRAAKQQADMQGRGTADHSGPINSAAVGKTESTLGRVVGCGGMEQIGAEKMEKARRE